MNTYRLAAIAVVGFAMLLIQGCRLDDRLDTWLARRIESTRQPGDDGCWLEAMKVAGWLAMFILFAIVNLGGTL